VSAEPNGNGFLGELKRRNVFRVAVAYLVTAWLMLQVADIVLENIDAPAWIIQVFMLALAVGFPVALLFAWAFELTPEGLKKEREVDRSQSITRQTGRKLDRAIVLVLAIAVVVLVIDRVRHVQHDQAPATAETAVADSQPSIAVLPFVNMSSDPEQDYFSDGISEEILNSLARVKDLKVAGRTSSFAFKGQNQDLRQIGETLGVEHILEGSVRKSGATVRITAQLIQVDDGFHLWSDTYDRELTDVFAIQDEIAGAILEQLKAHLVGLEIESEVNAARETDAEVYDLYLLARQRIYERKSPSIAAAADLLDKAIARDPEYAPAYALRGITALLLAENSYGMLPLAESWAQGKLYVDKALQLDPQLAEAWAGLRLYHSNRPGEHRQAIEALEKALAINPNLIDASNWLQMTYGDIGESRRALEIVEAMVERDPLYPPAITNSMIAYCDYRQFDQAWALLERVRPFLTGDPTLQQAEAIVWLRQGQPSRALPLLESAHAAQPDDAVLEIWWSVALAFTGEHERIVAESGAPWLRVIALDLLGRPEEAGMLATELAADGDITPLVRHLYQSGQHRKLVDWVASRWADLAEFERQHPGGEYGYDLMLNLAGAYAELGMTPAFEEAMRRTRAVHDRALNQNALAVNLQLAEGRYYALVGDPDRAIDHLERAVDLHLMLAAPLHVLHPDLDVLRGDPRYEALVARMTQHFEAERAAAGLEPVRTT
jgi:TolB-like protein/Tfp pilus assembly protein PilF